MQPCYIQQLNSAGIRGLRLKITKVLNSCTSWVLSHVRLTNPWTPTWCAMRPNSPKRKDPSGSSNAQHKVSVFPFYTRQLTQLVQPHSGWMRSPSTLRLRKQHTHTCSLYGCGSNCVFQIVGCVYVYIYIYPHNTKNTACLNISKIKITHKNKLSQAIM